MNEPPRQIYMSVRTKGDRRRLTWRALRRIVSGVLIVIALAIGLAVAFNLI